MDNITVVFFLLLSSPYVFAQNGVNPCKDDKVQNASGDCVDALVSRNIYVFAPPPVEGGNSTEEETPKPKLEYNIIFVRAPTAGEGSEPIVVPPPQQKTIVYVLSEKGEAGEQQIIDIPAPPKSKPEVYYVNYVEGENPVLPGGVDLQTGLDLESTTQQPVEVGGTQGTNTSSVPIQGGYTYAPPAPSAPSAPTGDAPQAPVSFDPQSSVGGAPQASGATRQQQQPNFFFVTPQPGFVVRPGSLGSFQQLGFPWTG